MTPRSLLVLAPAAAAAVAALAIPVTAAAVRAPAKEAAKDAAVNVQNFTFTPANAKVGLGGTVTWTFLDPVAHTASDSSGMQYFDSGAQTGGARFSWTFIAAGTYHYRCNFHATMTGTVSVPMKFKPKTGGTGTSYTITWATAAPPAGFVFDVQIRRPGAAAFSSWQNGVSTRSATFHPDAGTGSYQFQARLRKTANGSASGYSTAKGIRVS